MTTVGPGISKKANDLICSFLVTHQGATTDEIIAGTGKARSTVQRVTTWNPLISSRPSGKGKIRAYSIDVEALTEGIEYATVEAKNRYDEDALRTLGELSALPFDEQIVRLKALASKISSQLDALVNARHVAIGLQGGHIQDGNGALFTWGRALDNLESIKGAGLLFSRYTDQFLESPVARSQTEWWSLFPRVNSNVPYVPIEVEVPIRPPAKPAPQQPTNGEVDRSQPPAGYEIGDFELPEGAVPESWSLVNGKVYPKIGTKIYTRGI